MNWIYEPWPWYIAGPLISLVMLLLLYFGKSFGVSSNLRTICTISGAGRISDFFQFNWKSQIWNLLFVFGAIVFLPGPPMVNRVLAGASKAPDLASTLVASAANAGIAIGAIVGAQALSNGVSYAQLPVIGFVFAVIAAAIMLFSLKIEQ